MMRFVAGFFFGALLAGGARAQSAPMVRVYLEYIDLPHRLLTEVMDSEAADSGPALHAALRALVKEKKASILETNVLMVQSGMRAKIESFREHIYEIKWDPGDGLGSLAPSPPLLAPGAFPSSLRPGSGAFETRMLGVFLEMEPMVGPNNLLVDLNLAPEIVNLLRMTEWMEHKDRWGDAGLRMPVHQSLELRTAISLQSGKFELLGVLTPNRPAGGLELGRKYALFVKADVIPIELPVQEEKN